MGGGTVNFKKVNAPTFTAEFDNNGYMINATPIITGQPTNEIWYTSTDGNIVNKSSYVESEIETFGANIVSNTYVDGKGIIKFDGTVTSVGVGAFAYIEEEGSSNLLSISMPNSVTSIGDVAFAMCSNLIELTIPNSVTSIGEVVLTMSPNVASIAVELGNPSYDSRNNCNAIIETESNTLIQGCKNTTIPNSVTNIGNHAFSYCTGLTSITIPDSVTDIGIYAFDGCSNLTEIIIPNSVTSILGHTFNACTSLTSVTIPSSVTFIGDYAFNACTSLSGITLPISLEYIGVCTFYACTSLTSVTIPSSVTFIGAYSFRYSFNLREVICNSITPPSLGEGVFDNNASDRKIKVPSGSVDAYKTATNWSRYADDIISQ